MIIFLSLVALAILIYILVQKKPAAPSAPVEIKPVWRLMLLENVQFYKQLKSEERQEFEERICRFLETTKITGIQTDVQAIDKLLVAASAIIPIFKFKGWDYPNLNEVLLYPAAFNQQYQMRQSDSNILGMVGSGSMEGKMILSKPSLIQGFKNEGDKKNVGIHEFVHLIDKADGVVDGIPQALLEKPYVAPWIQLAKEKIEQIHQLRSDINPYGGVNQAEFLSVISEYFFERPKLLKQKHPQLYELLTEIYASDLSMKYKDIKPQREINRNDHCPCGSGKKFKKCCGGGGSIKLPPITT